MSAEAKEHLSPVWTRIFNVEVERGEGTYLFDIHGRRYLDFTCGIAVTNTGHCHPKVVQAIQEQAAKLIHGQMNIVYHQPALELVTSLLKILPEDLTSIFFANSGAEAIEAAIKLAKHATGRSNVIVFSGSFHGRTHLTMSMTTSKTSYRHHYQPLVPGIFVSPFPYSYYYGWSDEETTDFCLQELRKLLLSQSSPQETACMVIELVLGEGGYVPAPPGFLPEVEKICKENGILFILDEVQTGFGRTGKWFALEHYDVRPDILVMGKGIASGLPLSGIATRPELAAKWSVGSHGGTFGGNVVACAAAVATIKAIKEDGMLENALLRGQELLKGLKDLQKKFPAIGDVRGLGLMVGVEFSKNGQPDKETTKAVVANCAEEGLLLLTAGTYDNIIRWIPPLIVSSSQIREALEIFEKALSKASG